jgi:hypothetical protein
MADYHYRVDQDGNPLIEDCQSIPFFRYYTSPESLTLFRAIYNNEMGIQDKFVNYWAYVSSKLSQNKFVLGYDPINEPGPGKNSLFNLIVSFLPGQFDSNELTPLYEKIYKKYQLADPTNIMFFEPSQFPDTIGAFGGIVFNLGFTKPPGGEYNSPYHVLNDHTYCCQLDSSICDTTGEPVDSDKERCLAWHKKRVGTRVKDAEKLGVPLILSEFGSCLNSESCVTEINQVGDISDEHLVTGWAYWQFKTFKDLTSSAGNRSEGFYNKDGSIQVGKVRALSRTYIKAAQGTI